jgi:hypothetical protein
MAYGRKDLGVRETNVTEKRFWTYGNKGSWKKVIQNFQ